MSEVPPSGDPARQEIVALIPALRAFARTFCREPSDADDLVQETILKALANLDKFEPGTRLKSWLFTIMRNTFYTRIKARNREVPGLENLAPDALSLDATQDWSIRGRELERAFMRLSPQYREILTLVVVLGESYEMAAEICGVAVGTVKSRLNRARRQLMIELGEDM